MIKNISFYLIQNTLFGNISSISGNRLFQSNPPIDLHVNLRDYEYSVFYVINTQFFIEPEPTNTLKIAISKFGFSCPIQQPGPYWDRPSALPLVTVNSFVSFSSIYISSKLFHITPKINCLLKQLKHQHCLYALIVGP